MPDYSIYVLPEGNITFSGGQLDGVTQGDGSHLVGETLTLDAPNWSPVDVTDSDSTFADNDPSAVLDGPATIDGTTFSSGTPVEAEYSLTLSDGTNTWTAVAFNITDSNPAYATVEGLAFIGPPGGFPPTGVPLEVTAAQEGPSFAQSAYATPICFAAGTAIATPDGTVPVEAIRPGQLVQTMNAGPQAVRWTGQRRVEARGRFAPVRFDAGAIGNARPLLVSRQHRMLVAGWRAELHFGSAAVLVPAARFIGHPGVRVAAGGLVHYVHLLFDCHQIVFAEGVPSESLHPGAQALSALDARARGEVLALFPELETDAGVGRLAAPVVQRGPEARVLLAG